MITEQKRHPLRRFYDAIAGSMLFWILIPILVLAQISYVWDYITGIHATIIPPRWDGVTINAFVICANRSLIATQTCCIFLKT
jgi:hypothetical protein